MKLKEMYVKANSFKTLREEAEKELKEDAYDDKNDAGDPKYMQDYTSDYISDWEIEVTFSDGTKKKQEMKEKNLMDTEKSIEKLVSKEEIKKVREIMIRDRRVFYSGGRV